MVPGVAFVADDQPLRPQRRPDDHPQRTQRLAPLIAVDRNERLIEETA
jgi:hypothetical protein